MHQSSIISSPIRLDLLFTRKDFRAFWSSVMELYGVDEGNAKAVTINALLNNHLYYQVHQRNNYFWLAIIIKYCEETDWQVEVQEIVFKMMRRINWLSTEQRRRFINLLKENELNDGYTSIKMLRQWDNALFALLSQPHKLDHRRHVKAFEFFNMLEG